MIDIKIYWTENEQLQARNFGEINDALKFSEEMRKLQRDGKNIKHIVMSVENTDDMTKKGVDVTGTDYNWKKRRK